MQSSPILPVGLHFLSEIKKNLSMPLTDSVIAKPAARKIKPPPAPGYPLFLPVTFLATKAYKIFIFLEKWAEKAKERLSLIRQPARAFTQATRGVDRLPSAVWEEAELRDQSPTHRG